jgi:hypothetical protein
VACKIGEGEVKIRISKVKAGYWVVDRNNGLEGYENGGTLRFCNSFAQAWIEVFGVYP